MVSKERGDQVSGGVFLIGIAVLFMTGYWWPGVLFVIGASAIARGMAEGKEWYNVPGGLWMIALGIIFAFGFSFGKQWQDHQNREQRKAKNEEKPKHDSYIVSDEEDLGEVTIEDRLS